MKALGSDVLAFYREWPPGDFWYLDDYENEIENDKGLLVEGDQKYDLNLFGVICWQGKGDPPNGSEDGISFEAWFKRWKKARDTATVSVELPKGEMDAFLARMKAEGIKILSHS